MKQTFLLIVLGLAISGCSTTEKSINHVPWYEDLNPATGKTLSDWSILDLDTASYQRETSMSDDIWNDTIMTFW